MPNLIGYDLDNIYLLHYNEGDILISRINYVTKRIYRNIYQSNAKILFSSFIKNNLLYLGESELVDGQLISVLKRINLQNNAEGFTEEIIFKNTYSKFPDINYSDDYVLMNISNYDKCILGYMYHDDNQFFEIFSSNYVVNDGYLYQGDIPLYGNGDKQGIYFQVISLDNEAIDFAGKQALYYYSFAEDKCVPKLELSDKTTYVGVKNDTVILNDYAVDEPWALTGKIISFNDNTVLNIPKTRPANSVKNSEIRDDFIFVSSNENICVFNRKEQTYAIMDITTRNRTEIKIFEDTFGFLNMENGQLVFNLIRYSKD
jgi:hypothetical protein